MANETGGYLTEIQKKLNHRVQSTAKPTAEGILTVLTDSLDSSEKIQLQPIQIQSTQDGQLSISVGKDKQLELATLLPDRVKFVSGIDFSINKSKGILTVPTDRANTCKPLGFRMKLAHEIGHSLDPDYDVLDEECKIEGDSLSVVLRQENARLRMEVNAWSYGKAIADAMGVDELHYEDITHHALTAYQMSALEKIAIVLEGDTAIDAQSQVELYNPITQDFEILTIQSLKGRIAKLYETNEIFSANDKLKQIDNN